MENHGHLWSATHNSPYSDHYVVMVVRGLQGVFSAVITTVASHNGYK